MSLAASTRLGPYEILSRIGAGGMGEVYRARDTRLDRIVAIKVVAPHVAGHPEFRQRLEREARTIASLSHPHICALHDVGQQDGMDFLVMEYLEGQTLADRLRKGALPLDQTLGLALQIAEALDQAHRKGVVHRDLKPGNIMLTKAGAKLLDFGLAKVATGFQSVHAESTRSAGLTREGHIVGTLQYMAPEQLHGRDADSRTDIFSFGAVLYEMVTGRKAFEGATEASLIAAIVEHEPPPIAAHQPAAPAALDRVIRACLVKDPDERWQTARDLLRELKWIGEAERPPVAPPPRKLPWIVAAICALAAGVFYFLRPAISPELIRFTFPASVSGPLGSEVPSVSPDGRRLVFRSDDRLWLRSLDSTEAKPLAGTEGAAYHFWSPDSQSIAFFGDEKLRKVSLAGGPAQTVCDSRFSVGASWSSKGEIVLSPVNRAPLYRVPASGGSPSPITTLAVPRGENSHRWPQILPDGRHFLFLARSSQPANNAVYIGSLDSGPPERLMTVQSNVAYAPPGFLLFVREGNLMEQAFDLSSRKLAGEPSTIAERVHWVPPSSFAPFSVSADGRVLAYRSAVSAASQLFWFDRSGKRLGSVGQPGQYSQPRLSPDGRRAMLHQPDARRGNRDLWAIELSTGVSSRITTHPANDWNQVWSPDGSRVAFASDRLGLLSIYERSATGTGGEELVLGDKSAGVIPEDWSLDGRWLLYHINNGKSQDLWLLPQRGDRRPVPLVQSEFTEVQARFSPDGRFVAYASNESGRFEVYVCTNPSAYTGPAGKWRVSTNGGEEPKWRRDGRELYYLAPDKILMAVDVTTKGGPFEAGRPKALFKSCGYSFAQPLLGTYDVAADGKRFLINCLLEETASSPITVTVNWSAGLKR